MVIALVGRKIKYGLLVGSTTLLIATGLAGAFMRPDREPDQRLVNRYGDVVWNHEQHARMKEIASCTVCHHKEEKHGNMNPRPCHDCHELGDNEQALLMEGFFAKQEPQQIKYEGDEGPPAMTAFHGKCTGCHRAMKQGPTVCRDCHAQIFSGPQGLVSWDHRTHARKIDMDDEEGLDGNCIKCHHYDKDAETDGDYRACGACHKPAVTKGMEQATDIADHKKFQKSALVESTKQASDVDEQQDPDESASTEGIEERREPDESALAESTEPAAEVEDREELSEPVLADGVEPTADGEDHKEIKHGECRTCHVQFNPEDDQRSCQHCHKGWMVKSKNGAGVIASHDQWPSLEQAIHERCRECHHGDNPELQASMPIHCRDCHKPDPSWLKVPGAGNVMWDHRRHGEFSEMTCDTCHHTDHPDAPHMACGSCHGTGRLNNPPLEDALAKSCLGCHREKRAGLVQWAQFATPKPDISLIKYEGEEGVFWWDHRFHAIGASLSCRECHHNVIQKDGKYLTAMRINVEWPEQARMVQSCRECHGQAGPHPDSVAAETGAPSIGGAYKELCVQCHVKLEGGPLTWPEFFAIEPLDLKAKQKGKQVAQ